MHKELIEAFGKDIILTGSRYFGCATEESDYDYVVFYDSMEEWITKTDVSEWFIDQLNKHDDYIISYSYEYIGYTILTNKNTGKSFHVHNIYNYLVTQDIVFSIVGLDDVPIHVIIGGTSEMFESWKYVSELFKNNIDILKNTDYKLIFDFLRNYAYKSKLKNHDLLFDDLFNELSKTLSSLKI